MERLQSLNTLLPFRCGLLVLKQNKLFVEVKKLFYKKYLQTI